MEKLVKGDTPAASALLKRVAELAAAAQLRAGALDTSPAFPIAEVAALRAAGVLLAPAPVELGGLGLGSSPEGAADLMRMLRLVGWGNLSVGRLLEGHVNAFKLIASYGTRAQIARASEEAAVGHLFALWVTEGDRGLVLRDGHLHGGKRFCSGAGHVDRALVTARREDGTTVMVIVGLEPWRVSPERIRLQGMRASVTGLVDLSGLPAGPEDIVGREGDYLCQPIFSAGAWRTSAVTLGGLDSLVEATRDELVGRGRADSPHQLVRLGEMFIAQESAALWVAKAATVAEADGGDPGWIAAYVNLARIAVERAVLDAIQAAQRSLGLNGFVDGQPAERLMRDLATYLRQPAPDETLTEAAAWFVAERGLPE